MPDCCATQPLRPTPPLEDSSPCCSKPASSGLPKNLLRLEAICRIALAAFAYFVAPIKAFYGLVAGIAAGIASHLYSIIRTGQPPEAGHRRPVCAQGYMETLSGQTFSTYTNQIATAVFIGVHILHYPPFFAPFTGAFVGMWAGGLAMGAVWHVLKG